jgi:cytochrome c oxidase accessory protein FixG
VYLEFIFRPIETLFEGDASHRIREQDAKLTSARLLRKLGKWLIFAVVAVALGHSFVGYFAGPTVMTLAVLVHPLDNLAWFALSMAVSAAVLFDFGFFREQTCIIACPYGRFQSVFLDRRSLIVGYDNRRGEPRGKLGRNKQQDGGDCIDCGACVRTCPTGIDIRHGLQMECVGCTQCIDACDSIMDKIGRRRGLIRYSSLDNLEGKQTSWIRPRVFVYAAIVVAAASAGIYLLGSRSAFEFDVVRVTGSPYYVQNDGLVVNKLRLRITNRGDSEQKFSIEAPVPSGTKLVTSQMPIQVGARSVVPMEALIQLPKSSFLMGKALAKLRVTAGNGATIEQDFVLLGPLGGGS